MNRTSNLSTVAKVFIISVCLAVTGCKLEYSKRKIVVDGNDVDNYYNNFVAAGRLIKYKDRLFYDPIVRQDSDIEIFKLDSSGTSVFIRNEFYYEFMFIFGDELCISSHTCIDIENNKVSNFLYGNFLNEVYDSVVKIDDDGIYYTVWNQEYSIDTDGSKYWVDSLYANDTLLIENMLDCYITDEHIYYLGIGDKEFSAFGIYCYEKATANIIKIKEVEINDSKEENYVVLGNLIVQGDYILYLETIGYPYAYQCLHIYSVREGKDYLIEQRIKEHENINSFNVFEDKIYICSSEGLLMLNIFTKEEIRLSEVRDVRSCYILDDKWIYFDVTHGACGGARLYRVSKDGKKTEKVFDNYMSWC